MRLDSDGAVVLSRRNLLALLHKLDMPGSARTLQSGCSGLVVKCEDDDEHYANRPLPGRMHHYTEAFIQERGGG